jgi:galactose-1-phosphate uridylyltransferase
LHPAEKRREEMPRELHLLQKNDLPGEIEIHSDLLSVMPSALSRKRALKVGRENQLPMEDNGTEKCILCHPEQKPVGTSRHNILDGGRVACFDNDFPYLPRDQKVVFLWDEDEQRRLNGLHRCQLDHFGKSELFWLTKGCIALGGKYPVPFRTFDLMRMVMGFNIGRLAGQSIPHFHAQYGWEVVLNRRTISECELELYYEELKHSDLVIYSDDRIRVIAPWTPKGQFAIELHFLRKYEITEMNDKDIAYLTTFGHAIIQKYLSLGIQNLNIVFSNSPHGRKIEPLIVHFVPRVNMTALYEIKDINVVYTPPQKIAEEFRRHGAEGQEAINWTNLTQDASNFKADKVFKDEIDTHMTRNSKKRSNKKRSK